jgi:hypothetical protein
MLSIRSPITMAMCTPMMPGNGQQMAGHVQQYKLLYRMTDPPPVSWRGSLLRSAAPFPWKLGVNPLGGIHARAVQVLPNSPPPGWLPQTSTYRFWGRGG